MSDVMKRINRAAAAHAAAAQRLDDEVTRLAPISAALQRATANLHTIIDTHPTVELLYYDEPAQPVMAGAVVKLRECERMLAAADLVTAAGRLQCAAMRGMTQIVVRTARAIERS